MDSIPCDIVILPSAELAQKAIALSQQLRQHGTLFTLKDGAYFPHASLYMTQLKIADLDKVKTILADIAANTPQLDLTATRYDQAEGFIDADYARTETLDRLQMTVVEAINPIRDGMREKDKARMLATTGKARENLEKYGYRGVGGLFRPHITFTRFADGQPIDTGALPKPSEFSDKFIKLGLFEMGDNGTCVRKIAEFELSPPTMRPQ
jgi:uncharacterized protein DUF1045